MNPVKIRIGQSTAQVIYAGMTGAGLYQFNTVVPNLPDGDYPVVAEVAGVPTASIARIRIQRQWGRLQPARDSSPGAEKVG